MSQGADKPASGPRPRSAGTGAARPNYSALEGWRGVCACMVALTHVTVVGPTEDSPLIRNSYLFVDFFFALSGFVIFENYYQRIRDGFSISRFMFLRFGRLYPLHLFVLSVFVIIEISKLWRTAETGAADAAFTGLYAPDALFEQLAFLNAMALQSQDTWNIVSWSIGAEFYTYLIFALVIRFAGPVHVLATAGIIAATVATLWLSGRGDMNFTYDLGTVRCLLGFGLGALCSRLHQTFGHRWHASPMRGTAVELAMLTLIVIFVVQAGSNRFSFLAPFVFAGAVLLFAQESGAASQLMQTAPFRLIGRLSYSIYMMHVVVLMILVDVMRAVDLASPLEFTSLVTHGEGTVIALGAAPWQGSILHLLALGPVILISYFTYRVIEAPARQWSRRAAGRSRN